MGSVAPAPKRSTSAAKVKSTFMGPAPSGSLSCQAAAFIVGVAASPVVPKVGQLDATYHADLNLLYQASQPSTAQASAC